MPWGLQPGRADCTMPSSPCSSNLPHFMLFVLWYLLDLGVLGVMSRMSFPQFLAKLRFVLF